eukprot:GFYU01036333.1.p1 GENE.GFYU01036333.1~~GFYU01036333.1.p1  ORF type:complete len:238 (+),score=47.29 GFYU01036333.1:68-715(+)
MLQEPRQSYVGVICTDLSLVQSVLSMGRAARAVCEETYGHAPNLKIHGGGTSSTITYLTQHLEYILFEVIKNAMSATVNFHRKVHGPDSKEPLPSITVLIVDGKDEITIRISDKGGGIPKHIQNHVYEYGYTTWRTHTPEAGPDDELSALHAGDPMQDNDPKAHEHAGLGFGLPLSRLYARFHGGNLTHATVDGYGTHIYLSLSKDTDTTLNIEL